MTFAPTAPITAPLPKLVRTPRGGFEDVQPGGPSRSMLTVYLAAVKELGFLDVADVQPKASHSDNLRKATDESPKRLQEMVTSIRDRLAEGQIEVPEALQEYRDAQARYGETNFNKAVLVPASERAHVLALRSIRAAGEEIIRALRPIVDEAIAAAEKQADLLENIWSADEATAAGPKVAAAWSTLVHAHRRWRAAHELADRLRSEGLLPAPFRGQGHALTAKLVNRYRRWDLFEDSGLNEGDPKMMLLHGRCGPGIYTCAQVAEHYAAIPTLEPEPVTLANARPTAGMASPFSGERVSAALADLAASERAEAGR